MTSHRRVYESVNDIEIEDSPRFKFTREPQTISLAFIKYTRVGLSNHLLGRRELPEGNMA